MQRPSFKLPSHVIINNISLQYQEFKSIGGVQITVTNIGSAGNMYLPMYFNKKDYIGIGFNASNLGIFLYLCVSDKSIVFNKGDELLFYFASHKTMQIKFNSGVIRGADCNFNIHLPTPHELDVLSSDSIIYYKLTKKNGLSLESDLTYFPDTCRIINRDDFNEILNHSAALIVDEFNNRSNRIGY